MRLSLIQEAKAVVFKAERQLVRKFRRIGGASWALFQNAGERSQSSSQQRPRERPSSTPRISNQGLKSSKFVKCLSGFLLGGVALPFPSTRSSGEPGGSMQVERPEFG